MQYTIENFWIPRLKSGAELETSASLVQGWSFQKDGLLTFKEAPLTLDAEVDGDSDPERAHILLVSAPGAVGKTTLAKQIACETHSVYIDLAAAEPVGGNTLSGGLFRSSLSEKWNNQTIAALIDESRFAGYAPVVHAVAKTVSGEKNPSKLISKIKEGEQPVTLKDIASVILEREHEKLGGLSFQDPGLSGKLYTTVEQIQRLIARIYGLQLQDPRLPQMNAADAKKHSEVLDQWVPEHPFLDGSGKKPSSVVFGAIISAEALRSSEASAPALGRELGRGAAANPFLHEFYVDKAAQEPVLIPADHIGVIYSSLRASLSVGDAASLVVDEVEEPIEGELRSDVEIFITRRAADPRTLRFRTEQ